MNLVAAQQERPVVAQEEGYEPESVEGDEEDQDMRLGPTGALLSITE